MASAAFAWTLQSNNQLYETSGDGYFSIPLSKQFDTLLILVSSDTIRKAVDAKDYCKIILPAEKLHSTKPAGKLSSLSNDLKQSIREQYLLGNETYSSIIENRFIDAEKIPSTEIALNYNRASYSNIRRFLNLGYTVPPDAVRIDEMLNYFYPEYKEPDRGQDFRINSCISTCPWNKEHLLAFFNVYSKKIALDSLPPSHLVFLIDVSGSMDMPNRLPLLKSAFKALVKNLRDKDTVSIVVYGGTTEVLLDGISGNETEKITNVIDSLQPAGATPGESGIKLAYRIAHNHFIKGGNNRVILATDGDFNVGVRTEEELEKLIEQQNKSGIHLTCLGVGMGDYKDSKIQVLAQKGNGNFAYLDNYAEAEKVLFNEFFQTLYTVAENVILNVRFNTTLIDQYRLIGFDNKTASLKNKLSMIDGGDIGAGNSLLIAFEIIPRNKASVWTGSLANVGLSYTSKNSERKTYSYSALAQLTSFDVLERHYKLATAVLMFGMKLKKSEFGKAIRWNSVLSIAKSSINPSSYTEKELVQLIEKAKTIYKKENRWWFFSRNNE